MQKALKLDLEVPNKFEELHGRFNEIMHRGTKAGLINVSKDLRSLAFTCTAMLAAYMKSAVTANAMFKAGMPIKEMPDEINKKIIIALNELDDQMTLELSAL